VVNARRSSSSGLVAATATGLIVARSFYATPVAAEPPAMRRRVMGTDQTDL
jgi:hypothetical protein